MHLRFERLIRQSSSWIRLLQAMSHQGSLTIRQRMSWKRWMSRP
jgi:hypothetical protein